MVWNRPTILRRLAGLSVCSAAIVGAGCAGGPLSFKKNSTALVEAPVDQAGGVVTIDSLSGEPAASSPVQQTSDEQPVATAPAKPARKNFASLFSREPETNSLPDPFAGQPTKTAAATAVAESRATRTESLPKPSAPTSFAQANPQTPAAAAKARSTAGVSDDFDATMAALAGGRPAAKAATSEQSSTKANPFADLVEAKTAESDKLIAQLAKDYEAEKARVESSARKVKDTAEATTQAAANPFETFVAQEAAPKKAVVTLDSLGEDDAPAAAERTEPTKPADTKVADAKQPTADWIREATASLPKPSLDTAVATELATPVEPKIDPAEAAARERVRQLLDSSELALRTGRYDEAERIATKAFQIAEAEELKFGERDRTPTTVLRRVISTKRLMAKEAPKDESQSPFDFVSAEPQTAESTPTPTVLPNNRSDADNSSQSFPTVTTWVAVDEPKTSADGRRFTGSQSDTKVYHATTSAWQPAETPFVDKSQNFAPANSAVEQPIQTTSAESPAGQPIFDWAPRATEPSQNEETPFASELQAPAWPTTTAPAPPQTAQALAAPAWPDTTTNEAPALPKLPTFGESNSSDPFAAAGWPAEPQQTAMADLDVAPPEPMIIEGGTPEKSLNFGTILALMTVIGLGLVAVLAFRTRPEEA